ncbi:low temperature requirement protein A [Micromonospora sp. NPDC048999]|uniref:low temperature requirement protein A n=1 Tax=Micromonospora sp. NPDC048999 TaxID=3155391 RepID=UPI0033DCAF23
MARSGGSATAVGSQHRPGHVGFVELFFDVVFVFAFTRFSERLLENFTWLNTWTTLVLMLAMWWLWYRTVWTTNRYDPDRPAIQLIWSRPVGVFLLAALAPAALRLPPIVVAVIVAVVLAGIALSNVIAWRLVPRALAPPHTQAR